MNQKSGNVIPQNGKVIIYRLPDPGLRGGDNRCLFCLGHRYMLDDYAPHVAYVCPVCEGSGITRDYNVVFTTDGHQK